MTTIGRFLEGRGLALVGYRGSGKSTVGRILADRTALPFVDLDREIEGLVGRSISEIFAESGESEFRDLEEQTLQAVTADDSRAVIATGGGIVLRDANRRRLRKFGPVVWLRADAALLAARLANDKHGLAGRPPLTAAGTLLEIEQILETRTPLYSALADAVIETGGKTPGDVAAEILGRFA
jgi:shikimate kinase